MPTSRILIERLFATHRAALQAFFYRRVRAKYDAADLVQEVYLRLLRVTDADAIKNPEGYLFTVASNLVFEQTLLNRRHGAGADADRSADLDNEATLPGFEEMFDTATRVERLREVLTQLPGKCQAVVHLKYEHGLSYDEIATRLAISPHMVQKYVGLALAHCRRRMARLK